MKRLASQLSFAVCVLLISILTSGGCEIKFSSDDDDDGDGGNGGGLSVLGGTLISIDDDETDIDGIIVRIRNEGTGVFFSTETDPNGDFLIEDFFSGFPSRLEFDRDDNRNNGIIAFTGITVFPGANINLGDITITGTDVRSEELIDVDEIVGDVDVDDSICSSDDEGRIIVTGDDTDEERITVDINSGTNIENNDGDDIPCQDLLSRGGKVEVEGVFTVIEDSTLQARQIILR